MQQQQQSPNHIDKHGMSINLTLILALGMIGLGLLGSGSDGGFFIAIGVAFAAFSWLTTPRSYMVFDDRLVIMYGQPRIRVISFESIERTELLRLPIGDRVAIWLKTRKRYVLQPRNPGEFYGKLSEALGYPTHSYVGSQTEEKDVQTLLLGEKISPDERQKVLELLARWSQTTVRIEAAINLVRLTAEEQSLGMQSEEFEKARLEAIEVVNQTQGETTDQQFWPFLENDSGARAMFDLRAKLEESHQHHLSLLRLEGDVAGALRDTQEGKAPSADEIVAAKEALERALDQIGVSVGQIARYYRISPQEYQR